MRPSMEQPSYHAKMSVHTYKYALTKGLYFTAMKQLSVQLLSIPLAMWLGGQVPHTVSREMKLLRIYALTMLG